MPAPHPDACTTWPWSPKGSIQVFDIWDAEESFEAFGATLIPILSELGVDPGEPMVAPVHHVIAGSARPAMAPGSRPAVVERGHRRRRACGGPLGSGSTPQLRFL